MHYQLQSRKLKAGTRFINPTPEFVHQAKQCTHPVKGGLLVNMPNFRIIEKIVFVFVLNRKTITIVIKSLMGLKMKVQPVLNSTNFPM